jgi:hypothetical protein
VPGGLDRNPAVVAAAVAELRGGSADVPAVDVDVFCGLDVALDALTEADGLCDVAVRAAVCAGATGDLCGWTVALAEGGVVGAAACVAEDFDAIDCGVLVGTGLFLAEAASVLDSGGSP